MGVQFSVSVVLRAVDRISATVTKITGVVDKVNAPFRRLGATVQRLSDATGFPRLRKAVGEAGQALGSMGSAISGQVAWLSRLAFGAGAAATAVFVLVRSYASAADEISETSTKLGVGVEALQAWRYAAKLTDVGNEALTSSLAKLTRVQEMARRGNQGAIDTWQRLGLEYQDAAGRALPLEDLLPRIADKLAKTTSAARRNQLAVDLFGKSGVALVPMLAGGSAELERMTNEARRLGVVLDANAITAAAEFADQLDRTTSAVTGVRNVIAKSLLPVIDDMARRFERWLVGNRDKIERWARNVAQRIPGVIDQIGRAVDRGLKMLEPWIAAWQWLERVLGGPVNAAIALVAAKITIALVPAIISCVTALYTLSAAMFATPAGWIAIALGAAAVATLALGAAAVYAYKHWDELAARYPKGAKLISKATELFSSYVIVQITQATASLEGLATATFWVAEKLSQAWDWITGKVEDRVNRIVGFFTRMRDDIVSVVRPIRDAWNWLAGTPAAPAVAGAPGGAAGAAPGGGAGGAPSRAQQIAETSVRVRSEAAISIDLPNAPRGTQARVTRQDPGVDLQLGLGYAMGG